MPKKGEMAQIEESSDIEARPVTDSGAATEESAESGMGAGMAMPAQTVGRISPVDRSLVTTGGEMLDRRQLNDLRRKLRTKYH